MLNIQSSQDINVHSVTNNLSYELCFFSTLENFSNLIMITFFFWANYFLIKMFHSKERLSNNIPELILLSITHAEVRKLGFIFIIAFSLKRFAHGKTQNLIERSKFLVLFYMKKIQKLQLKAKFFDNQVPTYSIYDTCRSVRHNLINMVDYLGVNFGSFFANIIFNLILLIIILINNDFSFVSIYVLAIIVIFILLFFVFNVLMYSQPKLIKGFFLNDIAINRRFGIKEKFFSIFQKFYKIFEDYLLELLYVSLMGVLMPLILMKKIKEKEDISCYLIMAMFFLWKDFEHFKFMFSFKAKSDENKVLLQDYILPKQQINGLISLSLLNFPLKKKNNNVESNNVVINNNKPIIIIGKVGKTTIIKKIFNLLSLKNKENVLLELKNSHINNPKFGELFEQTVYLNAHEDYSITINQFFKMEDDNISEKEIFDCLGKAGILRELESKYKNILDVNFINLSLYEKQVIGLSKIFIDLPKTIFVGERIFNNLSPKQKEIFLDNIKKKFKIIIIFDDQLNIDIAQDNVYNIENL